jgi:hypothetical protein
VNDCRCVHWSVHIMIFLNVPNVNVDAFHLQKDVILKNGTCVVIYTWTCALCRLCESVLLFLFVVLCQAVLLKYLEHIKTTDVKCRGDRGYLLHLHIFFCCATNVCTEIKFIHNVT